MGNSTGSYCTSELVLGPGGGGRDSSLVLRSLTGLPRSSSVEALCRGQHDDGLTELDVVIEGTSLI